MNRVSTSENEFSKERIECLDLSRRQMKIARLLAWGHTQKEIANELNISPLTVSVHMRNIYHQLSIHKETDLTRWYLFKEYCINDNPFKKVLAVMFLILSITTVVFDEEKMVRVFRSMPLRTITIAARTRRVKRYVTNYSFKLSIA